MLSDAERATLGEICHRLGRKVLAEVAMADSAAFTLIIDQVKAALAAKA